MIDAPGAATCWVCFDTRLWIMPNGRLGRCHRLESGAPHNACSRSAEILYRAAMRLREPSGRSINALAFSVAVRLAQFTSARPCPRDQILEMFFTYSARNRLRNFHAVIEELRRVWLLPVGSRKEEPAGYWIITDEADFALWVERSRSAPVTQLTTIHRVARANFPVFAEQLEFEFWNDVEAVE